MHSADPIPETSPEGAPEAAGAPRLSEVTAEVQADDWPQVPVLEPHHFVTEPMESEHHLIALMLFYTLMKEAFAGREDVFIGADLVCYFSELQVKNKDFRAPDGMVVLNVEPRERQGWIVWQEGGRYPDLAVEHMSPSTRATDLGKKLRIYGKIWQVREYYAFDLERGELHAFGRGEDGLERREPDADGLYPSGVLGARVGVAKLPRHGHPGPFLRLFDADGAVIPTADERAGVEAARAAAEAERAAAEAERAAVEAERAAAEAERAEREKARADALQAELEALKARLGTGG